MGKSLIIVESAAKTKTIRGFLGPDFELAASMGHVRDLPPRQLGVDVEAGFEPSYTVMKDKATVVKELRSAAKKADTVYLATDPDREGEAIAWHLVEALGLKDPQRIEFNEITRTAVEEALRHPRHIDEDRVNAQQCRRVLDRLVGYKLSPLLWRKVKNARSAGRVQSVAVRLIVEREREIRAFVPVEYWKLSAVVHPADRPPELFAARLDQVAGKKVEIGDIGDEATAKRIEDEIRRAELNVAKLAVRNSTRPPAAPLITSTLQRDASTKLGFRAFRTMAVAQRLYEGLQLGEGEQVGLITYMRTDSTRVANEARDEATSYIEQTWGKEHVGGGARGRRVRGAQEAHECIRPTSVLRHPDEIDELLPGRDNADARKLYRLIWTRFVASQMAPAKLETTTVDIAAGAHSLRASGTTVTFPGYMSLTGLPQPKKTTNGDDDDENSDDEGFGSRLPALSEGEAITLRELTPSQHFTQPPPRYTEASLVKTLEERGIGRPSTYAPILSTITERRYVKLDKGRFEPTQLGEKVTDALVDHFAQIMDVDFTANLEGRLDEIERGDADWRALLRDFYEPFETALNSAAENMERVRIEPVETDIECPECGAKMLQREGRYGPFLGCSRYPECKGILNLDRDGKPRERSKPQVTTIACEKCSDGKMVLRTSRRGPFLGCSNYPKCRGTQRLTDELTARLEAEGIVVPKPEKKAEDE